MMSLYNALLWYFSRIFSSPRFFRCLASYVYRACFTVTGFSVRIKVACSAIYIIIPRLVVQFKLEASTSYSKRVSYTASAAKSKAYVYSYHY